MHRKIIGVTFHLFLILSVTNLSGEEDAALTIAKLQHQVAVLKAKEELTTVIDAQVQVALAKDNSELALRLLEAKDKLIRDRLLPTDNALREAAAKYAEVQRTADARIAAIYASAIKVAEQLQGQAAAEALKSELKEFLNAELGLKAGAQSRLQEAAAFEARTKKICDSLQQLVKLRDQVMDDVKRQSDALTKLNPEKMFLERANKLLKSETWTVTCRITSIKPYPSKQGVYVVEIEPPQEAASMIAEWKATPAWTVSLTRERAMRVKAGDTLEISGAPTFFAGQQGRILMRSFDLSYGQYYSVGLVNSKATVRHQP